MPLLEFIVRFIKNGIPTDLGITSHPDGQNRIDARIHQSTNLLFSGQTLSLPVGNNALIIDQIASENIYLSGWCGTGDTDALFELFINGILMSFDKITAFVRTSNIVFPNGHIFILAGQSIQLKVTNTGVITSDYRILVYGNQ